MNPREYVLRFLGDEQRELVYFENGRVVRRIVDASEFLDWLFMPDVYYSVRSVYDILMDTWGRLVFDFDAHDGNLGEARDCAMGFVQYLDFNGIASNVIYTGRGYQVTLVFNEKVSLDIESLRQELKGLDICRLDLQVLNSNPVARLPYTYNTKANRMAVPVSRYDFTTESQVLEYANIENVLALFPESLRVGLDKGIQREPVGFGEVGVYPLCIMKMVTHLAVTGELDHLSRFSLAVFLLREFGYESAFRVFSRAGDFKERVTDYQLKHISQRQYLMPKCRKIEELGWCNKYVKCPFRPWLEPHMRWYNGG